MTPSRRTVELLNNAVAIAQRALVTDLSLSDDIPPVAVAAAARHAALCILLEFDPLTPIGMAIELLEQTDYRRPA